MAQTSSAIIVAIKFPMEYVKLCMSMRLGYARYSAIADGSSRLRAMARRVARGDLTPGLPQNGA